MAQVYHLNAFETQVEALRKFLYALIVTEKYRLTDTLSLCLHGSLEHCGVDTLGKHHALRMFLGCFLQLLCELGLLPHHLTELVLVSIPVGDGLTSHTAVDGSLCHSGTNLSDKTWVNWFRYEIQRAERQVVHLIYIVHHIGNRLLGKVGDGVNSSQLHLFVDGCGTNVKRTTEYVRETYYIIYLIRIVGTASRHEYVGTACHGILVGNLGHRVGKSKHNRILCH